jgi:hypothetical protein
METSKDNGEVNFEDFFLQDSVIDDVKGSEDGE